MNTYDELSPAGIVARVRRVSDYGDELYVEYRNGLFATVTGSNLPAVNVGELVLVRSDPNDIESAPEELWPEEPWIGIVRLKLDDVTVVNDASGRLRKFPTRDDPPYRVGNTVEVSDSKGIVRILSEDPIKYVDIPAVDDATISKFKAKNTATRLTFEDFGGLKDVVSRARELVEVPLLHKEELTKIGAKAIKGVLFTGPPGTGKTMLARIIAHNTDAQFYEISGPEIFSKWYGQSEEILRRLFEDAANQERAIIFFDEIDSVAGQRDDDSHEASKRVVAQLLTLMDGFKSSDNVIVIATTNRPQDIDVALRRPGRFDWEVNFPKPALDDRADILRKSARDLNTIEPLPHNFVSHHTEGWSAAELTAIWSEAALFAVKDKRSVIIGEDYVGGFERVSAQRSRSGLMTVGGNAR